MGVLTVLVMTVVVGPVVAARLMGRAVDVFSDVTNSGAVEGAGNVGVVLGVKGTTVVGMPVSFSGSKLVTVEVVTGRGDKVGEVAVMDSSLCVTAGTTALVLYISLAVVSREVVGGMECAVEVLGEVECAVEAAAVAGTAAVEVTAAGARVVMEGGVGATATGGLMPEDK